MLGTATLDNIFSSLLKLTMRNEVFNSHSIRFQKANLKKKNLDMDFGSVRY